VEAIIVRYTDDLAFRFQYQHVAEMFLASLRWMLKIIGLASHPDMTKLIEFGIFDAANRKERSLWHLETFDFPGFTRIWSVDRVEHFLLLRISSAKKMKAKLASLGDDLIRRINWDVEIVVCWLSQSVKGYHNYFDIDAKNHLYSVLREYLICG
jgi:hypothetical protein